MDIEQFRKAAHQTVDELCEYFQHVKSGDLNVQSDWQPGQIKGMIPDDPPQEGQDWSEISPDVQNMIMPGITHWQHPRFMAFYPANTTYESILGDMWAGAFSNPGFNWTCSPVCTELEVVVTDWIAKMLGLSSDFISEHGSKPGGGIIMGSASESVLTIAVAARERAISRLLEESPQRSREEISSKLVMYGTTETHSLGVKAGLILDIPFKTLPTCAQDDWGLRGQTLEDQIQKDISDGLIPFFTIATLGSTSSGAIDNMQEVVQVSSKYPSMFVHVDAAWGGVFLACPEERQAAQLEYINKGVDSFCTNLHKSGLVTFDASFLCVRDRKWLTSALDVTPPFLRSAQGDAGTILDYRNMQLALGRRFRSIKIYFVLKSYGVSGFQKHLRKLIDLGKEFEDMVKQSPDEWQLFVPRRWALTTIQYKTPQMSTDQVNSINKKLCDILSLRRDVMFTQTKIDGNVCLRVAIGSPNTTSKDVEYAWQVIKDSAQQALKESVAN